MGGKPKIRRNTNQRISSSSTMLKAEEKREIEKVHAELLENRQKLAAIKEDDR